MFSGLCEVFLNNNWYRPEVGCFSYAVSHRGAPFFPGLGVSFTPNRARSRVCSAFCHAHKSKKNQARVRFFFVLGGVVRSHRGKKRGWMAACLAFFSPDTWSATAWRWSGAGGSWSAASRRTSPCRGPWPWKLGREQEASVASPAIHLDPSPFLEIFLASEVVLWMLAKSISHHR